MSVTMTLHAILGIASVGFGLSALLGSKGSQFHRSAGKLFLGTIFAVLALTVIEAIQSPATIRSLGLLFLVFVGYLVFTSWLAITNRSAQVSWLDFAALGSVLLVAAGSGALAYNASVSADASYQGLGVGPYLFVGVIALLAAIGDTRLIVQHGLPAKRRLPRHIWRMGFALQMATASMFTGPGTVVFPESIRGSGYLMIPEVLVALVVVFWWVRFTILAKWSGN